MSMHLHVYVGPYVRAELPEGLSWDDAIGGGMELTAHQSDEASNVYFYAPNVPRDGEPERKTTYSRDNGDDNHPVEITFKMIAEETNLFRSAFCDEITRVMDHAKNAVVGWGVVPYWY